MASRKEPEVQYTCPNCESESERVLLVEEHAFMANTGEHFCFSVKIHDAEAQSRCLDCDCHGTHAQLNGYAATQRQL